MEFFSRYIESGRDIEGRFFVVYKGLCGPLSGLCILIVAGMFIAELAQAIF